nr:MAG TPA: hypothetical protein [Caudoviricetes sp.]
METTVNKNIMVNEDTTAFDDFITYALTRKLPEGYDIPPVEEIGMQNVEIIDSAEEAIQQPLANTDSSIAVNFSQMINKPEVEEVKTEVASVPDNGETKVNVFFPKNEHILSNYVDYDSFNKIKESNTDKVVRAVRLLNYKMADQNAAMKFGQFVSEFNPNGDPNKRLRYELIRHQGREKDLVVRLSTVINGTTKYYADIYPDLNKIDIDHHLISSARK